jgi:hypothetical protein
LTGVLGIVGTIIAVRLWRGKTIVPWNRREAEVRLDVLSVTIVPTSVALISITVGSLVLITRSGLHDNEAFSAFLLYFAALIGLVIIVSFITAARLFFFTRPRWLVPPHLRDGGSRK